MALPAPPKRQTPKVALTAQSRGRRAAAQSSREPWRRVPRRPRHVPRAATPKPRKNRAGERRDHRLTAHKYHFLAVEGRYKRRPPSLPAPSAPSEDARPARARPARARGARRRRRSPPQSHGASLTPTGAWTPSTAITWRGSWRAPGLLWLARRRCRRRGPRMLPRQRRRLTRRRRRAPTTRRGPTPSHPTPTYAPSASCADDATWSYGTKASNTCAYVARKLKRCKAKNTDGFRNALEACPLTCGTC